MKVGIVGMGVVGGTTAKVFEKAHEILPYDKYKKPYTNKKVLKDAEVIFICVPTPMKSSGEMDYSAIHNSLEMMVSVVNNPLVVLRSTAVSGTTEKLEKQYPFNFTFNPEFLKEKTAFEDMLNTDRVVIGANRKKDYKLVEKLYKEVFPKAKYIHVDTKTAEMIKYTANTILASQVAIANEIYQICQVTGVDYNLVKKTILLDERIGKNIEVPGYDKKFGFGGKCFPKDLNALIYLARENNYRPYLLEEVWRLNQKVR